ncbi:hypothetical protein SALGADO_57 [Arthrobacter phage Salgado]|uniref:Uncharacterized protein n=1 Tax=Arthrobacter phage Salgado TaxID=1772314 RepID=A0A0U4IP09_9CAUD|nr:hypothetical protein KMD22_gp57 [Arthrobacter phage Salgado]ALY10223.1 hypothetical protein SALGADO_57 [Arthrobacter phage Salgado]
MHQQAIKILKGAIAARLAAQTRIQERLSLHEGKALTPHMERLLQQERDELTRCVAAIESMRDSIKTLQAAEPVHAVSASYGPGQKVKIERGEYRNLVGHIREIADDGILTVRLLNSETDIPLKPSNVRAQN